jgi:hypothetical protein
MQGHGELRHLAGWGLVQIRATGTTSAHSYDCYGARYGTEQQINRFSSAMHPSTGTASLPVPLSCFCGPGKIAKRAGSIHPLFCTARG